MRRPISVAICVSSSLLALQSAAQNLESIGKEKPVTVTGGVSLNQILYSTNGIAMVSGACVYSNLVVLYSALDSNGKNPIELKYFKENLQFN